MARLAASPEIYHSSICICRIREQVNQVSHELIQRVWIQGTSWALAKRIYAPLQPAELGCFSFSFFSSFTPHPVCLPLRCVFQCSSWAIIRLQTCKYRRRIVMTSKSLPACGPGLKTTCSFASMATDNSVCAASHCAVTVYFVQYIFHRGEVALWRSNATSMHLPHSAIS